MRELIVIDDLGDVDWLSDNEYQFHHGHLAKDPELLEYIRKNMGPVVNAVYTMTMLDSNSIAIINDTIESNGTSLLIILDGNVHMFIQAFEGFDLEFHRKQNKGI